MTTRDREATRLRVALYSHDGVGLGHIRRNLLLATALSRSPLRPDLLLVSGISEARALPAPAGVDFITLPALRKRADGEYEPRRLWMTSPQLVDLRTGVLRAALLSFAPDLLIVDKKPRGVMRELEPTLRELRRAGRTRIVLGLRDVLDDPQTVRRDWDRSDQEGAIREYYDEVWVYGDPNVYDLCREYHLGADTVAKVHFLGYLDQKLRLEADAVTTPDPLADQPHARLVLGLVGGGEDGAALAEAFVRARFGPDWIPVLVTGPFLPPGVRERLHALAGPTTRVLGWVPEPAHLLRRAERVIAMGGYNTVGEVLSLHKTALIVPRVAPRTEQLIRAERLAALGLLQVLTPAALSPQALEEWVETALPPAATAPWPDMGGLERMLARATELTAYTQLRQVPAV